MPLVGADTNSLVQVAAELATTTAADAETMLTELSRRFPSIPWRAVLANSIAGGGFIAANSTTNAPAFSGAVAVGISGNITQVPLKVDAAGRLETVPRVSGFSIVGAPAANAQATITQAAAPTFRHVCRAIAASLVSTAALAVQVSLVLRDGATGVGAVLWQVDVAIPATANSADTILLTELHIPGTVNTAMTLEFTAAGGAATFEKVTLVGYDLGAGD